MTFNVWTSSKQTLPMLKPILPKWLSFDVMLIVFSQSVCTLVVQRKERFYRQFFYVYHIVQDGTFSVNHLRVGSIWQWSCLIGCEVAFEFESGFTFILMGFAFYYNVLAMILLWLRQRDFFYFHALAQFITSHVCLFLGCFRIAYGHCIQCFYTGVGKE